MTTEKYLIEQTKRTRVKGTGPRRNELPVFKKISNLSPAALDELNRILDATTGNDIGGDSYGISQNCNYEEVFNVKDQYRQVLLQTKLPSREMDVDESAYTQWTKKIPTKTRSELAGMFKNIYRFRLAEMDPGHALNWHIDTDTSVICRAQICLNTNDSELQFKTKDGEYHLKMLPGEVWFINTGWTHRAIAVETSKKAAIFGFHWHDLRPGSIKDAYI